MKAPMTNSGVVVVNKDGHIRTSKIKQARSLAKTQEWG